METIKAGTRCECRDESGQYEAGAHHCTGWDNYESRCTADAVQLVTVPVGASGFSPFMSPLTEQVPMCATCAKWHESKAGAR